MTVTLPINMTHRVVEPEKQVVLSFVAPKQFAIGDKNFVLADRSLTAQLLQNASNLDQATYALVSGAIEKAKLKLAETVRPDLDKAVTVVTDKAKAKYQGYAVVMDPTSYEHELSTKVQLLLELSIGNQYGTLASQGIEKLLAFQNKVTAQHNLLAELLAADTAPLQGSSLAANTAQEVPEGKKA